MDALFDMAGQWGWCEYSIGFSCCLENFGLPSGYNIISCLCMRAQCDHVTVSDLESTPCSRERKAKVAKARGGPFVTRGPAGRWPCCNASPPRHNQCCVDQHACGMVGTATVCRFMWSMLELAWTPTDAVMSGKRSSVHR